MKLDKVISNDSITFELLKVILNLVPIVKAIVMCDMDLKMQIITICWKGIFHYKTCSVSADLFPKHNGKGHMTDIHGYLSLYMVCVQFY